MKKIAHKFNNFKKKLISSVSLSFLKNNYKINNIFTKKSKFKVSNFNKYLIFLISLLFIYLFYLSLPSLYDKGRLQKDLSNKLLNEFNIDSYGVDISKVAIQKAKELFPVLSNKFAKIDGKVIPFKDSYFDISICESVIDSMNYNVAKKIIRELERVTDKLTFISFISGDDSEHYREYSGDEIVRTKHEKDTIQSWYNWTKINDLLSNTNYKIKWARLVTEESLIDSYKYGRYNVVLEK